MNKTSNKYYIVITPFFPSENTVFGAFIFDQVNAIRKTKRFRDVLVFKPTSLLKHGKFYEYEGIKVHLFGYIQLPSLLFNGCFNAVNSVFFLNSLQKFGINPSEVAFAHAHTSVFAACALALKKKNPAIKTLVQHHDADPYTIRNGIWASWRVNARFRAKKNIHLFNQVDYHVCISRFVKRHLLEFPHTNSIDVFESYRNRLSLVADLPQIKAKNTILLNNGVDCSKFTPKIQPTKMESFTIGCIAHFVDLKGHITLLRAINRIQQTNLSLSLQVRLIGTGPTLQMCKEYVKLHSLDSVVSFEQEVHHHKLRDFYHSLDLFVLPSYFEGFGCVFLEAFACGIPFISCRHQGIEDYLSEADRDIWLIEPNNDEELADKIIHFIQKRHKQKLCAEHDISKLIERFIAQIITQIGEK